MFASHLKGQRGTHKTHNLRAGAWNMVTHAHAHTHTVFRCLSVWRLKPAPWIMLTWPSTLMFTRGSPWCCTNMVPIGGRRTSVIIDLVYCGERGAAAGVQLCKAGLFLLLMALYWSPGSQSVGLWLWQSRNWLWMIGFIVFLHAHWCTALWIKWIFSFCF